MALGSPKVSIFGAGFPRKVSTIAIAIGGLASFFVFGLLLRLSYPTSSSSVGGIFYGIGAQEPVEFPVSLHNLSEKVLYKSSDINTTEEKLNIDSSSDTPDVVNTTIPTPDSDSDRKSETLLTQEKEDVNTKMTPPDSDSDKKLEAPLTQEKEGKVPLVTTESTDVGSGEGKTNVSKDGDTPVESSTPHDDTETASAEPECDLYQGSWFYDPQGPLYTNNSCPVLTQMQNCQGNGRPDKGYESWRWKPSGCDLPRFDARKFLDLMKGKTLAFIGDSVARNQMESMLCLLWQVETPVNRGSRKMQRWFFKKSSVMVARIWSSWLVHQFNEKFDYAPEGVTKLNLDLPDERIMEAIPKFDVVVLSSGHWFAKQSVYILKDEIVGGQLWWPDKSKPMKVNNVEAFGISVETILKSMATHPNYKGLTIVRTFSPDHYEGGAWNTGGSCTGKEEPVLPGKLMKNGFTEIMHEKQATGYNRAVQNVEDSLKSKLKLMDITEVFGYRHDGHPGPYRSPDPNKITKRGPDGRPPPQDCLHWCMPGPVDTWNEMVLEVIRRDFEGSKTKNSSS